MKFIPDFKYEDELWGNGYIVIGIDEVGRGAFAGPLGIGGVVFDPSLSTSKRDHLLSLGIKDSKKLTPKRRVELSRIIIEECLTFEVCFIDVNTINKIGIGKSTLLGMKKVAQAINNKLETNNPFLLIDAYEIPGINIPQKGIIYGDNLSLTIASASIIAKVERDRLMEKLSLKYPDYGFEQHKGYGTKMHRDNIMKFGISSIHRKDFVKI